MEKFITKEYLENSLKVYNNTIVKPLVDSAVPKPTAADKVLLSAENAETSELEWSQVDKSEVGDSNYSYIPLISTATDYLTFAESCKMWGETKVRIHGTDMTNSPFGVTSDTDFFVTVQKINDQDKWITMYAKDVRTNRFFVNTKNNETWLGWKEITIM